jgi:hypothetical protein
LPKACSPTTSRCRPERPLDVLPEAQGFQRRDRGGLALRFTLHRPGQHRASPRRHDTPRRDIPRRVHISITGIHTGDTAEKSLALATLRSDIPTHRTTLTRERRIDSFHPPSRLMLQTSRERRPGGVHNGPVQASLLRHLATGLIDGAPRRADHVRHPQILDPDHVVPAGDDRGGLLHEIPAPIRRARMQSRQPSLRSLHREVPHEPGLRAMPCQQHFLLTRRIQAKPHNRRLTVRPDNSGFLPTLKGGVSTRDSR